MLVLIYGNNLFLTFFVGGFTFDSILMHATMWYIYEIIFYMVVYTYTTLLRMY